MTCGLEFTHNYELIKCFCSKECNPKGGLFITLIKLDCEFCHKEYYVSKTVNAKRLRGSGTSKLPFCSRPCSVRYNSHAKSIDERFWEFVDKTPGHGPKGDCWIWIGQFRGKYGKFAYNEDYKRKSQSSHRMSYALHHNKDLKELAPQILHSCDIPACVNPTHLSEGTHEDNMKDMVSKRRGLNGEKHHQAKLNNDKVRLIRQLRLEGVSVAEMSRRLGVTANTVSRVIHKKSWTHVE